MSQANLSSFIWSVADLLRGDYKQSEYGKVILPLTVLRRLDCVQEPTKDAVLKEKEKRETAGLLYLITEKFAGIDLHPKSVSNAQMGGVFEELIRKFAELSNETAGEHFTPREVIRLMVNLPTDMFYNTGISTYIWILTNRKPEHRRGKVQLIDASSMWQKMRKSLGSRRKELSEEHIAQITKLFGECQEVWLDENGKPVSRKALAAGSSSAGSSATPSKAKPKTPAASALPLTTVPISRWGIWCVSSGNMVFRRIFSTLLQNQVRPKSQGM